MQMLDIILLQIKYNGLDAYFLSKAYCTYVSCKHKELWLLIQLYGLQTLSFFMSTLFVW